MIKKGELEINWIVTAVIALVVLVVVLIVIYGASGEFGKTLSGMWRDIRGLWGASKSGLGGILFLTKWLFRK